MVKFEPDLTEAVEFAAQDHWTRILDTLAESNGWDTVDDLTKLVIREMVLPNVKAAAPFIVAQTLRWAADKIDEGQPLEILSTLLREYAEAADAD